MKKLLLFAILLCSHICKPGVIYVSNLFDSGPGSLRHSIFVASPNDTINFSVYGQILIDSPLVINRNVSIISPDADSIEITSSGQSRIMEITGGDQYISGIFFIGGLTNNISSGGIIWKTSSGILTIDSTTFFSSTATYDGGAISQDSGSTYISRSYFWNCDADSSGGSIRTNGGSFFVIGCTFEVGSSGLSGAAISSHGGIFQVVNSTFYGNDATLYGGACEGDSLILTSCTITNNSALGGGGGVKPGNGGMILNCIVYDNHAPAGPNFFGPFNSAGYNFLGDTSGSGTLTPTDLFGLNPSLGSLTYANGGQTPTCALLSGSPCIDAGTCLDAPGWDQRDSLRIGIPDIGAYEFGGTPFTPDFVSSFLCDGDTIFFPTDTIFAGGVYDLIFTTSNGCDSAVELTISTIVPDVSVTQNSVTLTASATPNTFQWLDCNSNSILLNETSQSFTATSNGSYAVIVDEGGCVDTSICTVINTVGIESLTDNNPVLVYPSVINDVLNIRFHSAENGSVVLYSVTGDLILEQNYSNREQIFLPVNNLVAGIYLLSIRSSKTNYQGKVIRE